MKHQRIRELIRDEALPEVEPGQMLQSERELATRFGASRDTIRRALKQLEDDGLVSRVHGSGTYKTDPLFVGRAVRPISFAEAMHERGLLASYQIRHTSITTASPETASQLQLAEDAQVFDLERLLFADNEPIAIERSYFPLQRFPDIETMDFTQSTYSVLRDSYGIQIAAARERIGATILTSATATILAAPIGTAALLLEATTLDPRGTAVVFSKATHRADRHSFEFTIRADLS